jgi:hypothetical protein
MARMRKIGVLLIALFVASPCIVAQQQPDEATTTLFQCGKPLSDKMEGKPSEPGGTHRLLAYKGLTLVFDHNPDGSWKFGRAYSKNTIGIQRAQAGELLPCFAKVNTITTTQQIAKTESTQSSEGSTYFAIGFFVLLIAGAVVTKKIADQRRWNNRPGRLCIACNSVRRPLHHPNRRAYCPNCFADNPIPLDSPAAVEYFARRTTGVLLIIATCAAMCAMTGCDGTREPSSTAHAENQTTPADPALLKKCQSLLKQFNRTGVFVAVPCLWTHS